MKKQRLFMHLEDGCRVALMEHLSVQDVCPGCGAQLSPRVIDSWRAGRRIHCAACDWCGTWRSNTIVSGSVLSCAQIVMMMIAFDYAVQSNTLIASKIGVHADTVSRWRRWWQSQEDVNHD